MAFDFKNVGVMDWNIDKEIRLFYKWNILYFKVFMDQYS